MASLGDRAAAKMFAISLVWMLGATMAQSIQLPCPHCNTEASGFVLIHWYRHPTIGNVRVVLECNVCHEPIIAAYPGGGVEEWTNGVRKVFPSEVRQLWVAPIPKIAVAPNGVPDNIASLYAQAMSSFQRQHYDAAGPLFRRIMETSIKKLHPAGKGSLYER